MPVVRPDVKLTYAEYRLLPETGPRYQLIEGDLRMSPAPNLRHQVVVMRLAKALINFVDERGLGIVLPAPLDVVLSDENVLQPDIVYVSKARRRILVPEGLRGAPDLCVEVLSEKTESIDRDVKRILYERYGVLELWLADPDANTLEHYRLLESPSAPARTLTASDVLASPLLPGFSLALGEVFRP